MITVTPKIKPQLDPEFIPAITWNNAYRQLAKETPGCRNVRFAIERPNGNRWIYDTPALPMAPAYAEDTLRYAERLVKSLLWTWGGSRIRIAGADELVHSLGEMYSPRGIRKFDHEFMGTRCFDENLTIAAATMEDLEAKPEATATTERTLEGNRIGFDLGGSDRKCAAVIDGEVIFSEEVKWSPYFESDPAYHRRGIEDSLRRAAAHLPSVDAIGGSAAGVYIDNEPRIGSLFRGVSPKDFDAHIKSLFKDIQSDWNDVPFEVANDGDVTAIAGAMAIGDNAVLGVSMGTSQAAGYLNKDGNVEGWLNELAFVPVDYRTDYAIDEWSGDAGCGVQYFSQQGVARLIPHSGLEIDAELDLPEKLEAVQNKMAEGDARAASIYRTIGTYFGYAIAHYADLYDFRHLLVLGRVSSGQGGNLILEEARRVLDLEFPALSSKINFHTPDEANKRVGQAIAAASLPRLIQTAVQ